MSRPVPILAGLIVLVAPFGEGGRAPLALLALHSLALGLVLAVVLGEGVAGGVRPRGDATAPGAGRRGIWIIGGLLCGALLLAALSAARSGYPLAAGLGLMDLTVASGLFVFSALRRAAASDLARLRDLTVASASMQAVLALVRGARGDVMRAGSGFLNPNHLAAFLNIGLLLAATAAAAERGSSRRRAAWMGLAGLNALALARLQSRGACLALAVALCLFAALRWRAWPARTRRAAALSVMLVLGLGVAVLAGRLEDTGDAYRFHRLRIWAASTRMLGERPWLGFGPGLFRHEAPCYNFPLETGPVRFGRLFEGAHCALLTLAVEDGAPAAIAWLLAATLTLIALARAPEEARGASRGTGLVLLALLVHGLVEDLQERPALTLIPALLAGTAWGLLARRARREDPESPRPAPGPSPSWRLRLVSITAASYLFWGAVLAPYLAHREAEMALRLGRRGLARMERAAALEPWHPEYRHDLAMASLNAGSTGPEAYARASIELLEARRLKPIDYRFPLLLGRLEAEVGRRLFDDPTLAGRAESFYREAAAKAPLDPRPRLEMAAFLDGLGRGEEALQTLDEGLRLEPHFVRARILAAAILLRQGHTDEAHAALAAAERSLSELQEFVPDSGYARDLVADDAAARRRLAAALGPVTPARGAIPSPLP